MNYGTKLLTTSLFVWLTANGLGCGKIDGNAVPVVASNTIYTSDTFEGRSSIGQSDVGLGGVPVVWAASSGTPSVSGGKFFGGSDASDMYMNPKKLCGAVQVTMTTTSGTGASGHCSGIGAWRSIFLSACDTPAYYFVDRAGNQIRLTGVSVAANDVLRLERSGATITAKINGTTVYTYTDTAGSDPGSLNYTYGVSAQGTGRMDNFILESCN